MFTILRSFVIHGSVKVPSFKHPCIDSRIWPALPFQDGDLLTALVDPKGGCPEGTAAALQSLLSALS